MAVRRASERPASRRAARRLSPVLLILLCAVVGPARATVFPTQASGVFVDIDGTILTVAHAVAGCRAPLVAYHGQVYRAERRAVVSAADLALLHTSALGLLAARWRDSDVTAGLPVFAAGYSRLLTDDAMTLTNALVVEADPARLVLVSAVEPGASGSPVLDGRGAVLGLVRARRASPGTTRGQAEAIGQAPIKAFLTANGLPYRTARKRELAVNQPKAGRARTLTVGILCGG